MRLAKFSILAMGTPAMVALAAPAYADPNADFANQLHGHGIYGPRDYYNTWLGKITCERLHNGLDNTADKSAHFVLNRPAARYYDRAKLPISRRRNWHLLPQPGADPDRAV